MPLLVSLGLKNGVFLLAKVAKPEHFDLMYLVISTLNNFATWVE